MDQFWKTKLSGASPSIDKCKYVIKLDNVNKCQEEPEKKKEKEKIS